LHILALDTSTEWCTAALWRDGVVVFREEDAGQRHSELILPMVAALLSESGVELGGLDGIAFGAGPGSFTGLRIACGVAQGMAFGAGLRLVGVSTLESLAQGCGAPRVIAALDARMSEIYHAAYVREDEAWRALSLPLLCKPGEAPPVDGADWTGCGSGFAVHREALAARYSRNLGDVRAQRVPHARDMAQLAAQMFARGEGVPPALAAPLYVRDKVAMTVAERAARSATPKGGEP
jgi:tRNA threonylcarbamoyladenosine biosynthesis protein TsaB